MTLFDKYRPRRLSEVVGQPGAAMLGRFARKPFRSCWLLEGPPGTGKSASAHALAEELGCTIFSKHVVSGNKLTRETAEQLFNHTVRCVPMDRARFRVLQFSGGPCFAAAAQERLAEIWARERPGEHMPARWHHWGWQDERFSMRVAVREMED
jgi:DNA polymerase III delta prime subunit